MAIQDDKVAQTQMNKPQGGHGVRRARHAV
jgi:hypothetical protein